MFNKKKENIVTDNNQNTNQLGAGTTLTGDIQTSGNIRIEGNIIGNITTQSKVVIGAKSKIDGNVMANNAEIEGEIKGQLEVSDILILKSTSKVHGDIKTGKLIVESGASFNGQCLMGQSRQKIDINKK